MSLALRRFNQEGLNSFRDFLSSCRKEPTLEIPIELLENSALTEIISSGIIVKKMHLETKHDTAIYLNNLLKTLNTEDVQLDAGLWSWLAFLFFDSLCPIVENRRLVKNDYHYIFEPQNMRHFYRHLMYLPWHVIHLAPIHNRLLLSSPLRTLNKLNTEIMKRLYLTRIPCIFEVLDRLYWNEVHKQPRKGITGSKVQAGNLTHRLPIRIRQLEKTYDLMCLNADQLIELLGDEFSFARPKSKILFEEISQIT